MLDFTGLLYGTALAADSAPAMQAQQDSSLMRFLPLFLIFGVFYFLLIRPQQKKIDEHAKMIKELKKGDKVITGGGVIGTITRLDDDERVTVEIADGVQVKVVRSTISGHFVEKSEKSEKKAETDSGKKS